MDIYIWDFSNACDLQESPPDLPKANTHKVRDDLCTANLIIPLITHGF